jgi:hypothetical protein
MIKVIGGMNNGIASAGKEWMTAHEVMIKRQAGPLFNSHMCIPLQITARPELMRHRHSVAEHP